MTDKASRNRFGWLSEEEDLWVEEARGEEGLAALPEDPIAGPPDPPGRVPGAAQRRRRKRPKNPKALRNDPQRMMAVARIRRDVRRRVEQALADPAVRTRRSWETTARTTAFSSSRCWCVGSKRSGIPWRSARVAPPPFAARSAFRLGRDRREAT